MRILKSFYILTLILISSSLFADSIKNNSNKEVATSSVATNLVSKNDQKEIKNMFDVQSDYLLVLWADKGKIEKSKNKSTYKIYFKNMGKRVIYYGGGDVPIIGTIYSNMFLKEYSKALPDDKSKNILRMNFLRGYIDNETKPYEPMQAIIVGVKKIKDRDWVFEVKPAHRSDIPITKISYPNMYLFKNDLPKGLFKS